MLIELPRECLGQEIIDTFIAVSSSKNMPDKKDEAGFWKRNTFIPLEDGVRYSPIKKNREILKTGVDLRWYTLQDCENERKWYQLRPTITKGWYPSWLHAKIHPVQLNQPYTEIRVDLKNIPLGWHNETTVDLDSPFHKEAVEKWQGLIGLVWENLSPGSMQNISPDSTK